VLRVRNVSVIVTERRRPFPEEADVRVLGLDVRNGTDVVVVKIGYLEPELSEMAADWRLARAPGGVDQDLVRWDT
jgi:microcystin degradation protein MlrC